MNVKSVMSLSVLLVFALIFPLTAMGEDKTGSLPPTVQKYPAKGSVVQTSYGSLTLYTTDSSSEVINFYQKRLNMDPVEEGKFLLGTDATYLDRPGHTDSDVMLKISAENGTRDALGGDQLFGFLQGEITLKKIRTEKDLQPVKQKYSHLAKAWYPDFDASKKLDSCSEATREGVNASIEETETKFGKDKQQEMLELIQQGRHQEAQILMRGMADQGNKTHGVMLQENKTDYWDEWIACLDEVDKHDFQTKIEIDLYLNSHFIPSTEDERKNYGKHDAGWGGNESQSSKEKAEVTNTEKDSDKLMGKDIGDIKKLFKF